MKIKWDFVTNSSSTAYLVCIPKNYDVKDILEVLSNTMQYEDELGEYAEDDKDKFFELVSQNIETLKNGGHIWNNEDPCFWSTEQYLREKDCIISSIDTSGDGMDLIQGVDFDKLNGKMKKLGEENEDQVGLRDQQ